MKIWRDVAADHSANLRIVGQFKTAADAQQAADLINELLGILSNPQTPLAHGGAYTKETLDFTTRTGWAVSLEAIQSAQVLDPVAANGDRIVVQTDELTIQLLIEAFIRKAGKIEIFSQHDYP